jgi:hypothetical protein
MTGGDQTVMQMGRTGGSGGRGRENGEQRGYFLFATNTEMPSLR